MASVLAQELHGCVASPVKAPPLPHKATIPGGRVHALSRPLRRKLVEKNRNVRVTATSSPAGWSEKSQGGQIQSEVTRGLIGEFLGTALLQFLGGAAAAVTAAPTNALAVCALVYAYGNASGAHLNPVVSFMLLVTGHISLLKALAYSVVQTLGALMGAATYAHLIPGLAYHSGVVSPGCFTPAPGLSQTAIFGWEAILTFFLCSVIYSVSAAKRPVGGQLAPVAIGIAVGTAALTGGAFTGACMNPARLLGTHMAFAYDMGATSVYVIAQFVGAAAAAVISVLLYGNANKEE